MSQIKLDKNYKIIKSQQANDEHLFDFYKDDLMEKIERILALADSGKIDKVTAKRLIKICLAKSIEKDFEFSLETLFRDNKNNSKSKILFLRFVNKTSYV